MTLIVSALQVEGYEGPSTPRCCETQILTSSFQQMRLIIGVAIAIIIVIISTLR